MTPGPLAGKRVVVTQAKHQAPELGAILAKCGAIPLLYPCIAIEPPEDPAELDAALAAVARGTYDWLVLTSANTVMVMADRLQQTGLPATILQGVRLAAIGAPTDAAVAEQFGRHADLVPEESQAEGLAQALKAAAGRGQRMLVPQADIARPVLVQTLSEAGLEVTPIAAYRTTTGRGGVDLAAMLAPSPGQKGVDAITFTSSSTVRNLLARLEQEGGDRRRLEGVVLACIGPVTADTLRGAGLPATVVATEQSLEGLVEALIAYYRNLL